MPKKPLKAKKIREDLTADQIFHLWHGWMLDDPSHPYFALHGDCQFPFRDDEHRRELYFKHRNYILSFAGQKCDFLFGHSEPEEKPKAYFDYEEA